MTSRSSVKPLAHKGENKGEVLPIVGANTKCKVQVRHPEPASDHPLHSLPAFHTEGKKEEAICLSPLG